MTKEFKDPYTKNRVKVNLNAVLAFEEWEFQEADTKKQRIIVQVLMPFQSKIIDITYEEFNKLMEPVLGGHWK